MEESVRDALRSLVRRFDHSLTGVKGPAIFAVKREKWVNTL